MSSSPDTAQVALLQTLLTHWDVPPITAIEDIHGSNPVWKVLTEGATYTIKDIGDAPDLSRLAFTRDVLAHVTAAGVSVPTPLPTRSGDLAVALAGRWYMLAHYIEAGEYPREPEQRADLFWQTGQAIAALHVALASYADPAVRERTWREGFATYVPVWAEDLIAKLPQAEAATVARIYHTWGSTSVRALTDLPEQLIHRDCHPGNILVDGTRVVGFVDCDHLCIGPRIFDLAYYASNVIKWITHDDAETKRWFADMPALVAGYAALQPLTDAERAALPHAMIAYHLLMAFFCMNTSRDEWIAREIASLVWLDQHLATVMAATERRS